MTSATHDPPGSGRPLEEEPPSLRKRAVHGALWTILGQGGQHALRLVSNLILARLLIRDDFGLMLAVTVFLQGLTMFSDIGLNAAIIQNPKGDDERFLNTVWTIQVLRGFLLFLLCLALAGPYGNFVEKPIADLVRVAGLSLLFAGFNSTSLATLNRHLSMRRLMLFQLGIQVSSTAFTIVSAVVLKSVWALVLGALFGSFVRMLLSHVLIRRVRCRFALDRAFVTTILGFGAWIFFNTLLGFAADQSDRLVLSKLLTESDLGLYAIAVMIAGMPYLVMVNLGGAIAFPLFGRARDEGKNLATVLHKVKLATLVCGGLCVSGLLAAGPTLIEFLYPSSYWQAGWMILPVAAGQWFRILCLTPANALFALGRLRWLVIANCLRISGYVVFVSLGWYLHDLPGALVGFAAGEVCGAVVYAVGAVVHRLGWPLLDIRLTLLAAVASIAGYFLREEVLALGTPRIVAILVGSALASIPWLLLSRQVLRIARGGA